MGVSRDCLIVWGYPPIISGRGRATNFKFGRNIHKFHPNQPINIFREKGAWAYPGLVQFFGYAGQ